ncbi:MAG TPA: hypothetical protein VJR89_20645, partial [Polyangiales bacterium]|nr:hypothetical protein [Polyangiales bacterium]
MGLPLSVPAPKASAQARAKALRVGLSKEPDARLRAALAFELAALTELRLEDPSAALPIYREARDADPQFRPALFALARLLGKSREFDELARVLAGTVSASTLPGERAAALVSLGCLFEDQLSDAAAAADSFERALHADPSCLPAALMLERALRGLGREAEADAVLVARTAHTFDPQLRSVLACEAARAQLARGQRSDAIETLLAAVAVRGRRFSTLLTLADLATEQRQHATAARAYEDAATLLAAHATGQAGPDADDIAGRLPSADAAMPLAAWLYRRAGQSYLAGEIDGSAARRVLERACASQRSELVLHMEYADVCQAHGDLSGARTALHALLDRAPPPRAAALQFRLAELAQHGGDAGEAETRLRAGLALDPESPVLRAALEDCWIDGNSLSALAHALEARAERESGEDARLALLRAAETEDARGDLARALALYRRCAGDDPLLLRELYGAALRAGDAETLREACTKLLAAQLGAAERSALWRSRLDAELRLGDQPAALATLRAALEDPSCAGWAGHGAWLFAARNADFALLAAAHQSLAARDDDELQAAAHIAGAGRSWLRLGERERAEACFRRVLELTPTDPYAVAMLEALLLEHGEPGAALQLLRDTAAAERDEQRSELALLRAGAAAEAAARFDLAAPSYEDAVDRNPDSLAALWARLRLAERSHDVALGTRSLRALAARELGAQQPGIAQLELAERLDVLGEWTQAVAPLAHAFRGEHASYEAAASALLLPRTSDGAAALRVRALGKLAQHAAPALRSVLEHEQVAELQYDA